MVIYFKNRSIPPFEKMKFDPDKRRCQNVKYTSTNLHFIFLFTISISNMRLNLLHRGKFLKKQWATVLSLALVAALMISCQREISTESFSLPSAKTVASAAKNNLKSVAVNGVMMQGFYWNVPTTTTAGDWWQNLGSKATELAQAGITAIWLPPAYKGGSNQDVGYGVYDRYDLGEFNQKGTVATRYGTLGNLVNAITAFHGQGVQVYEDIVMNHMMYADYQENVNGNMVWTGFSYSGRNNTYSSFKFDHNSMNGWQSGSTWYQWNAWDFQPYYNGDAYDNLMGCEIRYNGGSAPAETINWGNWITTKLNLDGYRCDAVKHIYTPFVNSWFDNVKGTRFAVSEAWLNSVANLNDYAAQTGGRTSLFDVPLHYTFAAMSNGNGSWDMRGLQFAGFTEANGPLSVSFVENHDTDDSGGALYSPVINLKMLAYAYILTREKGYPCVFYRDYYEYGLGAKIKTLIGIRKANAYGAGYEYTSIDDADLYAYSRAGDASHQGLLMMLNDGSSTRSASITTPFKNATLTDKTGNVSGTVKTDANGLGTFSVNSRSYSVWVPGTTTNQAPVVSSNVASGTTSSTALSVTISATDDSGVTPTIYYTTDGSTPTTSSASAAGSKTLTISASTTVKVFAVDNQGLASAVSSYVYTISSGGTTTAVTFKVSYSGTVTGQDVYIVGSTAQLGSWNTANAIKLSGAAYPLWSVTINLTSGTAVQYKYFRRTGTDASTVLWETTSANKNLTPTGASQTITDTW